MAGEMNTEHVPIDSVGPDYVIQLPKGAMLSLNEQASLAKQWEQEYPVTKIVTLKHGAKLQRVKSASSHPWNVNRIVRTRTGWALAGPSDSDVAVIPGPVLQSLAWFQPFAYGLAFLLLLWGCMAWEKWIGWVMR